MKMSKKLSLLLAGAMVIGTLAGCGSTNEPAPAQPENTDNAVEENNGTEEATEENTSGEASGSITLGIWPEDTEAEAIAMHTDHYVPAFNEKNPDVEVVPAYYKYAPIHM